MAAPFERLERAGRNRVFWALLFVVVVATCYAPSVSGPFFLDDEHFILKNRMVHALFPISDLYTHSVTEGAAIRGNFYRPNQQLAFAVLYQVFGDRTPTPYHLTSMGFHIVAAVLFQAWLVLLGFGVPLAGLAALIFLVHPVQTEAISYISGLADPMALTCMLAGLVLLGTMIKDGRRYVAGTAGVGFALVLALLSKESAIVFAPLALATTLFLAQGRGVTRRDLLPLLLVGVVVAGYMGLRLTVLRFGDAAGLTDASNPYTQSLLLRLTTFMSLLWDYVVLVVWPLELHYEKPYRAYASLVSARGAFGVSLIGLGLFAMVRARQNPRLALGAFVTAAGLLPFVGIVPLNAMYLEHWLYVPMVGISILVVATYDACPQGIWRRGAQAALLVLFVVAGGRTFGRNRDWSDIERFYLNEVAYGGDTPRIFNNLGMYYADQGNIDKAVEYYKKAGGSDKLAFPQPHHNLARLYAAKGQLKEAVAELRQALRIDPQFTYSLAMLRDIFVAEKDEQRAGLVSAALIAVQEGRSYDSAALNAALFEGGK